MANDTLNFTLALIDKISAPAKAASVALSALETQLKSVQALLKDMPKLALKVPKLAGDGAARAAKEQLGPMFGPGRKEAEKAARFREREELRVSRAAEREAKRLAATQTREHERATKEQEKYSVAYHVRQLQRAKAQENARKAAMKHLGIADEAPKRQLVDAFGATRAVTFVDNLKQVGAAFQEVTGLSAKAGIALVGFAGAVALAAAGAVKLGSALVGIVFDQASLAIEAAEAKQDTLDMLEAMLGSADAAQRTLGAIRDITKVTSASQEAVQESAASLSAAGVKNEKLLTDAVKSIAQVDSVLKGMGGKIQGVFEEAAQAGKFEVNAKKLAGTGVQIQALYAEIAKRTGVGVKAVEAQLKAGKVKAEVGIAALNAVINQKFGAVAAKQAKDLGPQLQRFKDNVSRLFEDVDTSPFLDALDRIITLFDTATPSGAAMHDVLTGAFNGLFKVVSYVEPYVKTFLKGLVIIALQVAIAFKPLMKSIRAAFGGESQSGPMRLAEIMSLVGLGLNKLITYAIKLGPVFSVAWSVASTLTGALSTLASTILFGIPQAIGYMISSIVLAVGWFAQFGDRAIEAGANLVSGLIEGIKNAAGQLYAAVVEVASTALGKFKDLFGIHSPSRVMAGMGVNLSTGLAKGIHAGAGASTGAMIGAGAGMASHAAVGARTGLMSFAGPQLGLSAMLGQRHISGNDNAYTPRPADPPRLAEPRSARGGSGPAVLHMAPGAVVIQLGSGGVAELEEKFPEMMANWWEGVALMNGTGD